MSDVNLAEVFNEEVEAEPVAEVVEAPQEEPPAVEEAVEAEPTGDKPEDSTPEPKAEEEAQTVPIAALMAERDKRKAAEQKWEQAQAEKPKESAPDVLEDQEGFTKHINADVETALFNQKANTSEFFARRDHEDLDSKVEKFNELQKANPQLSAQVQQAASPYHEIVDIVDNHERMAKLGDPVKFEAEMRTKIEAEMREKIMGEVEGKVKADTALRESIPTSLVKSSSKGSISGSEWGGPTTLEDALGD